MKCFINEIKEKEQNNTEDKQVDSENKFKCDQCDFESVQKNQLCIHRGMKHKIISQHDGNNNK